LNDSKESETTVADLSVNFGIDSESRRGALLAQFILFFFVLHVLLMISGLVNSSIKSNPVLLVVTCFHVPVKHAMSA
jgi:hypothetical protein